MQKVTGKPTKIHRKRSLEYVWLPAEKNITSRLKRLKKVVSGGKLKSQDISDCVDRKCAD